MIQRLIACCRWLWHRLWPYNTSQSNPQGSKGPELRRTADQRTRSNRSLTRDLAEERMKQLITRFMNATGASRSEVLHLLAEALRDGVPMERVLEVADCPSELAELREDAPPDVATLT